MAGDDISASVDNESGWNAFDASEILHDLRIAHDDRIIHPELSHEWLDYSRPLLVERDADDDQPFSPYCFCNSTKPGISALQGGHHVAQKSRIITLPSKSDDFTGLPSTSLSSHAGAFKAAGVSAAFAEEMSDGRPMADVIAEQAGHDQSLPKRSRKHQARQTEAAAQNVV